MFLFLFTTIELISRLEASQMISVDKFEIKDLNYSSLHDKFPVYFICHLTVLHHNFSILFRREDTKILQFTKMNLNQKEIFNYESESVVNDHSSQRDQIDYRANAVLFFDETYFLKKSKQIKYEILMNIFRINSTNDLKLTELFLKVILNNQNHLKRSESKPRLSNQAKRQSQNKYHLKIEACVHVHYQVYLTVKDFLNTHSYEYTRIYLTIYFAHLLHTIDKIYERINDPLYSIRLELVELFIYTYDETQLHNNETSYINKVNEYYSKHYRKRPLNCDHVFFIHTYKKEDTLGVAFVNNVCNPDFFTSVILFGFSANMELTMSHELGHNIGAREHDDNLGCSNNLMNAFLVEDYRGYIFSDCSTRQIKKNLFRDDELKAHFMCLVKENNRNKFLLDAYRDMSLADSPGYFYSLSDQCRLILQDANSFTCDTNRNSNEICSPAGFRCFSSVTNQCLGFHRALEGTVCGENRVCQLGECLHDVKFTKRTKSRFHKQISMSRKMCPQGSKQEVYFRSFANRHMQSFKCTQLLENKPKKYSYSQFDCDSFHDHHFNYSNICCETCLKVSLKNKCSRGHDCKSTTCETLKRNPCFNGGKCVTNETAIKLANRDIAFYCVCPRGYSGELCLTLKPCELYPCQSNEVCYEYGEFGQYYCLCNKDMSGYPECNYEISKKLLVGSSRPYEIVVRGQIDTVVRFYLNIVCIFVFLFFLITALVRFKNKV